MRASSPKVENRSTTGSTAACRISATDGSRSQLINGGSRTTRPIPRRGQIFRNAAVEAPPNTARPHHLFRGRAPGKKRERPATSTSGPNRGPAIRDQRERRKPFCPDADQGESAYPTESVARPKEKKTRSRPCGPTGRRVDTRRLPAEPDRRLRERGIQGVITPIFFYVPERNEIENLGSPRNRSQHGEGLRRRDASGRRKKRPTIRTCPRITPGTPPSRSSGKAGQWPPGFQFPRGPPLSSAGRTEPDFRGQHRAGRPEEGPHRGCITGEHGSVFSRRRKRRAG